jgi:hypothetical protein
MWDYCQVQSARDKSLFGKGDIRGVIAPEAANNASRAGALIPTVAFGIPGSLGAAILLSALVIKGLQPGPDMLTTNLDLTFSMIWDISLANILAAGLLMLLSRQVAKVAFLPAHAVVPGVVVVLLMGAWVYDGFSWMYQRPIVVVIEIAIVVTIILAARGTAKPKMLRTKNTDGAGPERSFMSVVLSTTLLSLFAWAWVDAQHFNDPATAQFPLAVLMLAIPLGMFVLAQDVRNCFMGIRHSGSLKVAWREATEKWKLTASLSFFAYLLATIAMAYVAGQLFALPVFVAIYARRWGNFGWVASLTYAAACFLVVWGLYVKIMNLPLFPSLVFG